MGAIANESRIAPELAKMLAELEDLPSIPETLLEVLRVLDDPESGATDLAQIVRLDAPLSAKILRLANSPYYGPRADITDVSRSISVLGYRTMRNVAISLTVATSLVGAVAKSGSRLDYRELWRHSVVTAAVAKHIAALVDDAEPEEVFSAGLLHDLGKFVLTLRAPMDYHRLLQDLPKTKKSLVEAETEAFGFNHADVGAAFAESWRFPEFLTRCIGEHHDQRKPADGNPLLRSDRVCAIITLADHLANRMEPPASPLGGNPDLQDLRLLHEAAGVPQALVESNVDKLRESITLATVFLSLT